MGRGSLIQLRRGTAAQWMSANPILAAAEAGYETDTGALKYGDGSTAWNALDYFVSGESEGASDWDDITGTPTTLAGYGITDAASITHSHAISDTTGLQAAIDGKAATSHAHAISDTTSLQATLDAKLAKAGGTMTGALTLSGAPSSSLHAATKAYVDGLTLAAMYYFVADYNASGSIVTTTGSITSGTNQLTVASASSFEVGQGIYVNGAGVSGAHLITSISAIAGTTLTLAANASTSRTNVLVQHDDTTAINNAMAAVVDAGGGRLLFHPGFYRCNGPLLDTNSVLAPPYIPISGGTSVPLSLEGTIPMQWGSWDGPESTAGVIIQSDVIGVDDDSCIFAMAPWEAGVAVSPFNNVGIYLNDILFRTYDNPQLGGLDLGLAGFAEVGRCHIDTGVLFGAEPTHSRFGFRSPRANTASAYSRVQMLIARNYYYGAVLGEQALHSSNVTVARCAVGIRMDYNYYPIAGLFLVWQCPTSVEVTSRSIVDWTLYIEESTAGWSMPISGHHIYDPTDQLHGVIRYSIFDGTLHATQPLSKTGATAVAFTNLRA